jgi:hypothetical protein
MVNGKEETHEINYRHILAPGRTDVVLMDNDTIYISQSFF